MNVKDLTPILIYDDTCYHCSRFASIVKAIAGGKMLIVGHYTELGREIKSHIFPADYDPTGMFWFVTGKAAYGGRAGVLPLLLSVVGRTRRKSFKEVPLIFGEQCKTTREFFMRACILLSNSKKIPLD
ncbi:MAG: hypothetical protein KGI33_10260 [Thaumarchaeota archaeon]|nr:hypothetical protein [Nitrososphaerota archaeon]